MFTLGAHASWTGRVCSGYNMADCSESNGHNMGYPHISKSMNIEVERVRIGGG
jgi:hypothetical protein